MCDDVQSCNRCVREFMILARIWFAFGLPSKTGCDISGIKALLTVGPLTYTRMVALRTIDPYSHLNPWCNSKFGHPDQFYVILLHIYSPYNFFLFCLWFTCWTYSSVLTLMLMTFFVDGPS
jgi:hypothetical protein